ncbi:hypothetical protein OAI07_00295 [Akkermansiaceae bacterium]|nr:hypothetical protein [Akkermansiaceae bacterium]
MPFSQYILLPLSLYICMGSLHAEEANATKSTKAKPNSKFTVETHGERAKKLSYDQDDLSADVQDLIDEQTDTKIIELLRETEIIMADATDLLEDKDTGGATIATQTEIIEKIFEAAKQKQKSSGQGEGDEKNMGSMLQMMKNMMDGGSDKGEGKDGEGEDGKGNGSGGGGNDSGGGGNGSGDQAGDPDNTAENTERRVPKSSGNTGNPLPKEFQKAMDAYNKAAATQP